MAAGEEAAHAQSDLELAAALDDRATRRTLDGAEALADRLLIYAELCRGRFRILTRPKIRQCSLTQTLRAGVIAVELA